MLAQRPTSWSRKKQFSSCCWTFVLKICTVFENLRKSHLDIFTTLWAKRAMFITQPSKPFETFFCYRWKSWTASCQTSSSAWQKHFYPLNSGPSLRPRSGWGTLPQLKTNQSNEMPWATKFTRLNFLLSSLVYFYHHQLS